MKRNKKNVIGLFSIIFTFWLTIYLTIVIIKYPLIGIEVRKDNNLWFVENVYENGWASGQTIKKEDLLELVNGESPENHSTVSLFDRVEMAHSITLSDKNLESHNFTIKYSKSEKKYTIYLILPLLFSVTTILLSIFLYSRKNNDKSANILIYFLLSIGLCYLSAYVSTRGDIIGKVTNTITLSGSIILFFHFIKSYLEKFNLTFIGNKLLIIFYILNFIVLLIEIYSFVYYPIRFYIVTIKLLLFLFLICYLLVYLTRFYFKHKTSEGHVVLKILLLTLMLSFGPFITFYAIPIIFFKNELISAEVAAIFLIIIPITLVYLIVAKKLFDIDFFLNRLRYYSLLAFLFTTLMILLLSVFPQIQLLSNLTIIIWFTLFICTTLLLYLKEYLDYKLRHHLFSPKGDFETSLYSFFQKAKYETKVDSLITNLKNEIRDVLMVKEVLNIEIGAEDSGKWVAKHRNTFPVLLMEDIEKVNWNLISVGTLIEIMDRFAIVIGGDPEHKNILLFGMKKSKINLNIQERIWLETLAYFSSILLENYQLIEDLFEKIENYEGEGDYPNWLSRLMFAISEKERTNLSIDLHDSVLQDQLQLLREVEKITEQVADHSVKNDLFNLKERMLDNIHLVRETCNELQPPFLSELGMRRMT